jgi:hypothetical protein
MSKSTANTDAQVWFKTHSLPWSCPISTKLSNFGVECIEDHKILLRQEFMDHFYLEKFIVKEKAKLARCELIKEDLSFKNCTTAGVSFEKPPEQRSSTQKMSNYAVCTNNISPVLQNKFIKVTVVKTKEQKKEERKERQR